ncbi:MAG: molecular chaperone DnaJ [Candidatus Aminicenantes bacterium]|nr:molecular chaperone DnaJ [Candidatus Aminicenantes bacterium]
MSRRDYYDILGLDRSADPEEVKKAYRRMALKYHPDRNPGDALAEERFKEAAEAYSVLGDPEKRATYDRFGHDGLRGEGFPGFEATVFEGFEDILGNFFGFDFGLGDMFGAGRRRRGRAERGRDLGLEIELGLEEAAAGVEREIHLNRAERCGPCEGTGRKPGTKPVSCPACGGRGRIRHSQGFFTVARTCSRCEGAGEIIETPCEDCRGSGRTTVKRALTIRIPAGIVDGARLRIAGEGEAGDRGGGRGDLFVSVRVKPHPFFEREGNDLACQVSLSMAQAALGVTAEIPILGGGRESLKVPPGTQSGAVFKVRGRGLRGWDSRRPGDLFVHVRVRTPEDLTKEEKALLRELAEKRGEKLDRLEVKPHGEERPSVPEGRS